MHRHISEPVAIVVCGGQGARKEPQESNDNPRGSQ